MLIQPARFIAMATALLLLAGCIPLTQDKVVGGRTYDNFGYHEDMRCGLLQIGPSNRKRATTVIPNQSYAKGPDGTRHSIATEPHSFDLTQGNRYVRERIYLLDTNGQRITRNPVHVVAKQFSWRFHYPGADGIFGARNVAATTGANPFGRAMRFQAQLALRRA